MQRVYALTPSDFVLLVLLAIVVGYILPRHVDLGFQNRLSLGLQSACSHQRSPPCPALCHDDFRKLLSWWRRSRQTASKQA